MTENQQTEHRWMLEQLLQASVAREKAERAYLAARDKLDAFICEIVNETRKQKALDKIS